MCKCLCCLLRFQDQCNSRGANSRRSPEPILEGKIRLNRRKEAERSEVGKMVPTASELDTRLSLLWAQETSPMWGQTTHSHTHHVVTSTGM